ncbi:hypothetical protein N7457_001893 [Penicillium paradoxum]|uniref:uncharacterized protein n=1 Tax=Penicillium paradoxum TaxID=176176 RepID=UPI002547A4A1|nr:uncharacterized protein N7457_001893 [Penicillium paradoxum]KAJ5795294.1 hypothetical protein N7457_001893 [Penicillium paradoxum]
MAMENIDPAGHGFLGDLAPAVLPVYQYRDREQMLNTIKQAVATASKDTTSEWCLIKRVNDSIFTSEFLLAKEGPFASWSSYDAQLDCVLLRVTKSEAHEVASEIFSVLLYDAVKPMGMDRSLRPTGSATHYAAIGAKEADKAWKPLRLPRGQSGDWPSVVLEVAFSEMAITLQINQHSPNITIEKWRTQGNKSVNHLHQIVQISRKGSKITTTGSPLVIEFEKLFLRPPIEPRERDIQLDDGVHCDNREPDLMNVAEAGVHPPSGIQLHYLQPALASNPFFVMIWRARLGAIRIRSNDRSLQRWGICPRLPIWGYQRIAPLERKPVLFHRFSSQWASKSRVFPVFDLELLDSPPKFEEEPATQEPKEIHSYPVQDEEILRDRYQILYKIGYGPTATVWQAVDLLEPRMVVLKIYVVDYMLKTYGRIHPPPVYQQQMCPLHKVSDRFLIEGPHGPHICVVHEAPAMDTEQMHSGEKLDLGSIRSTMKQMLLMMDFLHTDCYLTARIHPNKSLDAECDREIIGSPSNEELITPMILPGDGVPLRLDSQDHDTSGIAEKHSRSPEEVLKSKYNHKTEIWHIGLLAWNYASSQELVHGRNSDGAFDDRVHIAELVALLGPPPPEFRDQMRLGSMFWDEQGNWTDQAPIPDRSIESLAANGNIDGEDVDGFLRWVRKALQWNPEDRPTALGLLRHEWMSQKTNPAKEEVTQTSHETA